MKNNPAAPGVATRPVSLHHKSRTKKRQENREQKEQVCETYNLWTEDSLPTDAQISNFETDPFLGVATFRLMAGIPEDTRVCPIPSPVKRDTKNILARWEKFMGHMIKIRVCAACGVRSMIDSGKLQHTSARLKCCIVKNDDLPPQGSLQRNAMHLVEIGGKIFKLASEGVDGNNVTVCIQCWEDLFYGSKKGKPPIQTIAHNDLGKFPPHLKKPSRAEILAFSVVVVFVPIIECRAVFGARNKGIKGTVFAMKLSEDDTKASLVRSLPRRDLAKRITLAVFGEKSTWAVAKYLAKLGCISMSIEVIIMWLVWLEGIGSPLHQNILFPKSDEEIAEARAYLKKAVADILKNAECSESALVEKMAARNRASVQDEKDDLDSQIDGEHLTDVLLSAAPESGEPMHEVLKNLQGHLPSPADDEKINSDLPITVRNEMMNEYEANHTILAGAFPHIFPFGLTEDVFGTATVSTKLRRTWMLFKDRRCAQDFSLIALLFDQSLRHSTNRGVAFRIKKGGPREDAFTNMCNEPGFKEKVARAVDNPDSKEARGLKKIIAPLVKIVGSQVDWTPLERSGTLGILYAMAQFFNNATYFVTISPSMKNSTLALRLTYSDNGEEFEMPGVFIRSKIIAENPVAAVQVFYRMMRNFFDIIVGFPLDHFTGRRANVDRLLHKIKRSTSEPTVDLPQTVLWKIKRANRSTCTLNYLGPGTCA